MARTQRVLVHRVGCKRRLGWQLHGERVLAAQGGAPCSRRSRRGSALATNPKDSTNSK
jgi:hypothetical protein